MIQEVLLVHHSHTDIGYTHSQPVVLELHNRFIEMALDCADATHSWPDDCRFKWTCEVTGITVPWWKQASNADRERFLNAVKRGQFEVAGLQWNLTPLVDDRMLLQLLEPVHFLRDQGIPIRSAMNSDVNGAPWGLVDALLDFGIVNFSMGVNEHYGYAPQPRPRAFWWESPTNRKVLVWNGLQYWNAANIQMHIPESIEAVALAMPIFLKVWEDRGYPYSFLPVQVTTASSPDNASPDPDLPCFVRDWNDTEPSIRLKMATLSEVFDRLQQEPDIPTLRGDWTDWWNFGGGSTAREVGLALDGQRMIGTAEQLQAWPGVSFPRQAEQMNQAQRDLALYTEHTWGSDRSVSIPGSPETAAQSGLKSAYAYNGFLKSRMLRRDGLERIAKFAGGNELTTLIYNPLPYPIRRTVRLPHAESEFKYLAEPRLQHQHRQDVVLGDQPRSEHAVDRFHWYGPVEIPALGFITIPTKTISDRDERLTATAEGLDNGKVSVRFVEGRAGIMSLSLDGVSYVADDSEYQFCEPVLERPRGGCRGELFGPLDWRALNVHEQWKPNWDAVRETPTKVLHTRFALDGSCAMYAQLMEMSNGDRVELTYRLFSEAANVDLDVAVHKTASTDPHALYLPMDLALQPQEMVCHFATAGAIVQLDKEQIPYSSRHYVTTRDFIRLQDGSKGLTVATPDAPLWQIGGFTFGRQHYGDVKRERGMLNAWLTNNYWDVNFSASQSGTLHFHFCLIPHGAQSVEISVREALCQMKDPPIHVYNKRGSVKSTSAQLIDIDSGTVVLTQLIQEKRGLTLTLLNPAEASQRVQISPGIFHFSDAALESLSGTSLRSIPLTRGVASVEISPRAWIRLRLTGMARSL